MRGKEEEGGKRGEEWERNRRIEWRGTGKEGEGDEGEGGWRREEGKGGEWRRMEGRGTGEEDGGRGTEQEED